MPTARQQSVISFQALPAELAELSENLFPKSPLSAALLSLQSIDRLREQELSNWLHKKEIVQLSTYNHKKRNREWLGGRVCAKEGLRLFFREHQGIGDVAPYPQWRIETEESGRPCLAKITGSKLSSPELSISHSKGLAGALVSSAHCGIDIQYVSDKLDRVKERFSTPDEEQLLHEAAPQLSVLSRLTLLWAGKEAIKKMLSPWGMPGFHELVLRQLSLRTGKSWALYFSRTDSPEPHIPVAAGTLAKDYAIALCCRKSSFNLPPSSHA